MVQASNKDISTASHQLPTPPPSHISSTVHGRGNLHHCVGYQGNEQLWIGSLAAMVTFSFANIKHKDLMQGWGE